MIFKEEETEMNKFKNIIAVSAFSLMVLALPAIASAQWGGNNGGYPNGGYPNGGNYPNGSYGNNGRYGANLETVADRLKERSKDFDRQVDREMRNNNGRSNNGQYGNGGILGTIFGGNNGTYGNRGYGNDTIKRLSDDFKRAAADFENRTDGNNNSRNGSWNRGDSRDQQSAQRLLSIGSQLDNELRRMRTSSTLQYQWNAIRSDLSIVASSYRNNSGGRNSRFPF